MTVPGFDLGALRRAPDVEAPELVAVDATDRLLLDEAADLLARTPPGGLVVIGDRYGALTLGAVALHGATDVRTHQDFLTGELALAANAERAGLVGSWTSMPLGRELVDGARVVLMQLPRSLDALDEVVQVLAEHADPGVVVLAGGRVKHMTRAMNDVLASGFGQVRAHLARQKSRVLEARDPHPVAGARTWPVREHHEDVGLTVCAHGAAFAGSRVDLGTRLLLERVPHMPSAGTALDLGCGTGVLAVGLARARPGLRVLACDTSSAAVASALATVAANGVGDQVTVHRDDAASQVPDASVDLVVLNPPFHTEATVHAGVARRLFADAARVLRPGGELWTVWNSHLMYRKDLERLVGPTRQVDRTPRFTVTASVSR
ncbi:class I SAM-dependent methyltransferase [Cellulomonas bogoriensis]|uniref:SAM-dependent methyltransferase n=1 Tax=Cellulomonas bogoriensis 69B4 = DSM 16987 TaxID=1386082 RepID=A0A0A0C232_9CELL|nr:methyltransferase [Cellulomonas bogoriensis]KGM13459.1 SAM-dependent methyltransferase [Cellulomonas bogoriensis 69B4 = DSM 16987]